MLVKAFFESGEEKPKPMEALTDDQIGAFSAFLTKHGASSVFPVMQKPDKNLPKSAPVLDLDELRSRNATLAKKLKLA